VLRPRKFVGLFSLHTNCEAEPQPLFPGDVETSFRPAPRLFNPRASAMLPQPEEKAGNVREAGVIYTFAVERSGL
jgi:hypothetical protein